MTVATAELKLWSVTTLIKLGLGEGPGLVKWKIRQPAELAYDQFKILQSFIDQGDRDAAVKWLTDRPYSESQRAALRGTAIHQVAEKLALGERPEITPAQEPYVRHYRRWLEHFRPRFLMAEAPVYNPTEHYAGTLDGIVELDGRRLVVDYKTTEHPPGGEKRRPPFPEVALQLCAYRQAEHVGVLSEQRYAGGRRYYLYDPAARHEPMPATDGALCIVLSPFDCVAVPVRTDDEVWDTFLHVTECARWEIGNGRGLFGPPLAPPEEA